MTRSATLGVCLFLLLLPALAWGGPLDDYYLARLAPKAKSARLGTTAEQNAEPAGHAERCLTHLYRSLKRDWNELEPATQTTLGKLVSRPLLAGAATFPSPGGHFTIHYATDGNDAPDLTDTDQDQTPDWVETVAQVFDQVYQVEVETMGYRPPPGGRYDVYLRDLATVSVYGFTTDAGAPAYPAVSAGSYIEIDRAYTAAVYSPHDYPPLESLQVTAAHEYQHAIQFGYNYYFDYWYAEASATWIEDEVYDAVNQLYVYLPYYLPRTSTLSLNAGLGGNSEYGRWIFNRQLAEGHSPTVVRDIWARLGAMPAPGNYSDIPMVPVIDQVVTDRGSSIGAEFFEMAQKLYRKNWSSHQGDLGSIPALAPVATFSTYPLSSTTASASLVTLPRYTFAYYRFFPSSSAPASLRISLSNVANGTELIAFKQGADGTITSYPVDLQTMSITIPSFNSPQTSEVRLLVCNGSAADGVQVSLAAAADSHTLTLSFAGTGGGSVNGALSCLKGGSCAPAQVADDAIVTLFASPNADSLFGGWSGACTGSAPSCMFTMDGNKTVSASFSAVPRLRILGGAGYSLIAAAYAAAPNGAVIQARELLFDDDALLLDRPVSLRLKGGYDMRFLAQSGQSAVKGKLTIRAGTLRVEGVALR